MNASGGEALADIFISYARADRAKIDKLSEALEAQGFSVWWDRHIDGGAEFAKDIEQELKSAKAVIVAWSANSVESRWVRDEAGVAAAANKLVTLSLDGAEPPLGFKQFHAIDYSKPNEAHDALHRSLSAKVAGEPSNIQTPEFSTPKNKPIYAKPWVIAASVAMVAVIIAGVFFNRAPKPVATPETKTFEETIAAIAAEAPAAREKSIAVLPFADMSAAGDQEYFSDGIAEEILNALVRVPELQVSGRTSSFAFKGRNIDMREIGATLNVAHILEGSVRKQGERVRITAQLIRAEDGFHLWSDTYDGTLEDIFDLQETISRSIVDELEVILNTSDGERLAQRLTDNQDAYDLYLRGRALLYSVKEQDILEARDLFESAVGIAPDFAEAWAGIVYANSTATGFIGGISRVEIAEQSLFAASRALALNPLSPDAHQATALALVMQKAEADAFASIKKAIELRPNDTSAQTIYGLKLAKLGRSRDAIKTLKRAIELDPLNPFAWAYLAHAYQAASEYQPSDAAARRGVELGNFAAYQVQADNALIRGDGDKAIDIMLDLHAVASAQLTTDMGARHLWEAGGRAMYKDSKVDQAALKGLLNIALNSDDPEINAVTLSLLARFGMIEDLFRIWDLGGASGATLSATFWSDLEWARHIRQHPKFPDFAEDQGYLAAWQEYGWPDKCQPIPGTDGSSGQFSCD